MVSVAITKAKTINILFSLSHDRGFTPSHRRDLVEAEPRAQAFESARPENGRGTGGPLWKFTSGPTNCGRVTASDPF